MLGSSTGTCTCSLRTILSVLDMFEYLIGENAKYLYLYKVKIKYFSSTLEPLICIFLLLF